MQLIINRDTGAVTINGRTHVVDCSSVQPEILQVRWHDDHGEVTYRDGAEFGIGDIQKFREVIDNWNREQQRLATR